MDDGQTRKGRTRGYHQWRREPKFTLVEKMDFDQAQLCGEKKHARLCVEVSMHNCVEKMNMHNHMER